MLEAEEEQGAAQVTQIFIFHFKELIDIAKHMESETEVKIHSLVI